MKFFKYICFVFVSFFSLSLLSSCNLEEFFTNGNTLEVEHQEEKKDKIDDNAAYYNNLEKAKESTALICYTVKTLAKDEVYGSTAFIYRIVKDGVKVEGSVTSGVCKVYIITNNRFLAPISDLSTISTYSFGIFLGNSISTSIKATFIANSPTLNLAIFSFDIDLSNSAFTLYSHNLSSSTKIPSIKVQDQVFSISALFPGSDETKLITNSISSGRVISISKGFFYTDSVINEFGLGAPLFNAQTGEFLGLSYSVYSYLDASLYDPTLSNNLVPLENLFSFMSLDLVLHGLNEMESLKSGKTVLKHLPIILDDTIYIAKSNKYVKVLRGVDKPKDVEYIVNLTKSKFFVLYKDDSLAFGITRFIFDLKPDEYLSSILAVSDISSLNIKKGDRLVINSFDELLYYFLLFDFTNVTSISFEYYNSLNPDTLLNKTQTINE